MQIDEQNVADPMSPEMVAGGSYLPGASSADGVEEMIPSVSSSAQGMASAQQSAQGIASERDLRGRASDVNDFTLTMRGISDGDPVGMETFDLGFFEDGTPAITINGANVPIRHEQWMALLTQRNKTRSEIRMRMEFEHDKRKAKDGISRILASAPSVPPQLGQLLMTIADLDPGAAMQETKQLLVSMSKDNGREQIGRLSTLVQDNAVGVEMSRLNREFEMQIGTDEMGDPVMGKSSAARQRSEALAKDKDPRKRKTAYAISNIDAMFPPKGMKSDPSVNGKPIGLFDMMLGMDGGDTSDLSRFDLLRHLAAYSDLWPTKVDWMDTPVYSDFVPGRPVNPNEVAKFRNYLLELDQWASTALKWDRSDPRAIDMMLNQAVLANKLVYNPSMLEQGAQGSKGSSGNQSATNDEDIDFGS